MLAVQGPTSPAALQDPPRDRLDARDNEANPAGWAAVISVRSGGMNDPTLVLGQVENGEFGHDARDLVELDPDREPWLTAVFPHPEWGEQAGDYGHDYHPWHDGSDEWHFVVRTGEELNSALVLRWRAPEDILARSQLVDLDTGEVIDMQKGRKLRGSWSTQWHGQTERHFAWVLEPGGRSNAVDRPVDGRAGSAVEQPEGGRRHESGDPSPQKGVEKAR